MRPPEGDSGTVYGEGVFALPAKGLGKYCELHGRGLGRTPAVNGFCALHRSQSCALLSGSSWLQLVAPRLSVSSSDMLESNMSLVSRADCTIWPSPPSIWVQKVGRNLVPNSVLVLNEQAPAPLVNQSINQSVFLEWPKWQATARTTTCVTVNVTE